MKQRIEKGLDEHETDFNLENILLDFKTKKKREVEEKLKKKMAQLCKPGACIDLGSLLKPKGDKKHQHDLGNSNKRGAEDHGHGEGGDHGNTK